MRPTSGRLYLPLLLLGIGAIACGDGDPTVELPFESTRKLAELSDDERRQVCTAGIDALRRSSLFASICALQGLVDPETSCEDAQTTCVNRLLDADACDDGEVAEVQCDVTVGQAERCMNDTLQWAAELLPTITCGTSLSELQRLAKQLEGLEFSVPDSCKSLQQQCEALDLGFGSLGQIGGGG